MTSNEWHLTDVFTVQNIPVVRMCECITFWNKLQKNNKIDQHWSFPLAFVLTWSPKREEHSHPVDPEEHEAEEGPERLKDQQGKVDEHFTSHMEQRDGESHTCPHEEHHYQENYLEGKINEITEMSYCCGIQFEQITFLPHQEKDINVTVLSNRV